MTYDGYDDYDDDAGRGCFFAAVGGLLCWAIIIATCIAIFGCGPTTEQIDTMSGVELWHAHNKSLDRGKPNMNVVRALRARGGITDTDVQWYKDGSRWKHPTYFSCWGKFVDSPVGFSYDWEAMGYASWPEVNDAMNGLGGSEGGSWIYTRHTAVHIRSIGGGSFSAWSSR